MRAHRRYKILIPELIVVHASATPITMNVTVDMIREWHVKRGFSDIGYHKFIKRDGTVHIGRDITRWGAHASGHNHNSLGICLEGGLDAAMQPEDNYTDDQKHALFGECMSLADEYKTIVDICGHRDLPNVAKACPCFDVNDWEDSLPQLGTILDRNYAASKHSQE